jgi:hypothetical protein
MLVIVVKGYRKMVIFSLIMFSIVFLVIAALPVRADEVLIWDKYVLSSGVEVTSPVLEYGKLYRIVADEVWWYNWDYNLAADAQYYTTDLSNSWDWVNHFHAPDGHSFLQINGQDVNWGPFSNGDTNHTYTIYYTGEGAALTFRIVDWMDGNYGNNYCKIRVRIYKSVTVGGYVVDSEPLSVGNLPMVSVTILGMLVAVPVINYCRKFLRRAG